MSGATENTPNREDSRITPEVQATPPAWTPPGGVLADLLASTRHRVTALRAAGGELWERAAGAPPPPSFIAALAGTAVAVVAEVKRRSPSTGMLNAAMSASAQARAYAAGGAAAVSLLTEPERFGGDPADVVDARQAVALPLLRKDFIVDPIQVVETRAMGASALLLIVRALPPALLGELHVVAREHGLDVVTEIRTHGELEVALACGARIIGVNSRDLESLEVDSGITERLLPAVPSGVTAVAESGIRQRADVERMARAGADAVLVGSALSASDEPAAATRALTGVARQGRG